MEFQLRTPYPNELCHHGVLGQKWGVRRYQNKDGSLTPAGKKKYNKYMKKYEKDEKKASESIYIKSYNEMAGKMNNGGIAEFNSKYSFLTDESLDRNSEEYKKKYDAYVKDYEELTGSMILKIYDRNMKEFQQRNKNFKKAQELVSKKIRPRG